MEKYKEIVRKRIRGVIIATLFIVTFVICMHFFVIKSAEGATGNLFSFFEGGVIGLDLVALVYMIQYRKALDSDEKLKKMYNEEHDERTQLIRQKAGFPVFTAAGIVLIIGGVAAGYMSSTVSYTMAACGILILLYQLALKFYYSRKY